MIKLVGPMQRLDLMPREEFKRYYVEQHTRAASGLPGNVKYIGSPALQGANGEDPPFDSVAEMYYEDLATLQGAYTSEQWEKARADHPSVVSGRIMFVTEEHTFLEPPPPGSGAIKYQAFLSRKDCMAMEDFRSYWLEEHMLLALQTPGLIGYRACPSICSANGDSLLKDPMDSPQFDGVIDMWFESVDDFERSYRDPFWDKLRVDYYQNFAMGRIQVLVEEHLVFDLTSERSSGQ